MHLVQVIHSNGERRIAIVDGTKLHASARFASTYELVIAAIGERCSLMSFAAAVESERGLELDYDEVYAGRCEWRLLPPIDHFLEQSRCVVSGTGLTHTASAEKRRAMHGAGVEENDSARMYRWGIEDGKPPPDHIGVSPEWFYKGNGGIVRAHGEQLAVPEFAEDAGEEPEIACIYVIDPAGVPRRIGMAMGNEFSDHKFERRNYLYLAASKLLPCGLGPELWIDPVFDDIRGRVRIERQGSVAWSAQLATGQKNMCHSLSNIEHHHFKFEAHRRPGDVHIHFLGADAFSFGEGVPLEEGDVVEIAFDGFGRPLRNSIHFRSRDGCVMRAVPV